MSCPASVADVQRAPADIEVTGFRTERPRRRSHRGLAAAAVMAGALGVAGWLLSTMSPPSPPPRSTDPTAIPTVPTTSFAGTALAYGMGTTAQLVDCKWRSTETPNGKKVERQALAMVRVTNPHDARTVRLGVSFNDGQSVISDAHMEAGTTRNVEVRSPSGPTRGPVGLTCVLLP